MAIELDSRLQVLVEEALGEFGLTNLGLDDDGFRSVTFGERVTVNLQVIGGGERLALFSPLGSLPEEDRESTLETMLRANHFWMATHGATLSLGDGEPAEAVLAAELAWSTITAASLAERIRRFADVADDWMGFLQGTGDFSGIAESQAALGDFVRV
jgi:hypothetical protein